MSSAPLLDFFLTSNEGDYFMLTRQVTPFFTSLVFVLALSGKQLAAQAVELPEDEFDCDTEVSE